MVKKWGVVVVVVSVAMVSPGLTVFGRIVSGDAELEPWWTADNPLFARYLEPSSNYLALVLPLVACALAGLFRLTRGYPWNPTQRQSAAFLSVASAVALFIYLPLHYRIFIEMFESFERPLPAIWWPVMAPVAQARWALGLVLLWLVLQPQVLERTKPYLKLKPQRGAPINWPGSTFAALFLVLVVVGLFGPIRQGG